MRGKKGPRRGRKEEGRKKGTPSPQPASPITPTPSASRVSGPGVSGNGKGSLSQADAASCALCALTYPTPDMGAGPDPYLNGGTSACSLAHSHLNRAHPLWMNSPDFPCTPGRRRTPLLLLPGAALLEAPVGWLLLSPSPPVLTCAACQEVEEAAAAPLTCLSSA